MYNVLTNVQRLTREDKKKQMKEMEQLSNGDYISQQDGTHSHTSKVTPAHLEEHCCKFLKSDFWPPNSRDLNPCDYAIWGALEAKIWKHNLF